MENWLEINLDRLRDNYEYIKSKSKSPICAVIKADGYGIGSYEIAKELESAGVEIFAVAFLKEVLDLRKAGIKSKILILNYISPGKLCEIEDSNLLFTIYSLEQLKSYLKYDNLIGKKVHLKINSGMNRLGLDEKDLEEVAEMINKYGIEVEGVYSHFAHVEDENFTRKQYEKFMDLSLKIEKRINKKCTKHISNSGATLKYDNYGMDFVRVGMVLYGLQPLGNKDKQIKGIINWKSRISNIRLVEKNQRISYGKELLDETKIIGTIPVGYSHGYMRQLNKEAYVMVKGIKARIVGKIFMDQMHIDLTNREGIRVGDEVTLLGDEVEAEKLAKFSETIADDIICRISPRIERIFVREKSNDTVRKD